MATYRVTYRDGSVIEHSADMGVEAFVLQHFGLNSVEEAEALGAKIENLDAPAPKKAAKSAAKPAVEEGA